MDTFDLRKFITEAKLSEQKKAYIEYEDGTTDDPTFHQSVSKDKIEKMLAADAEIKGKKIVKVLVGDSLDQPMNESDLGDAVEFYMNKYDDNEMPEEIRQGIIDSLEDGKSLEWVKNQIDNGFLDMVLPESLNEEKDVIEPKDVPEKEEEETEEDEFFYDEEIRSRNKQAVKEYVKKMLTRIKDGETELKYIELSDLTKEISRLLNSEFLDSISDTSSESSSKVTFITNLAYVFGQNVVKKEEDIDEISAGLNKLLKVSRSSTDVKQGFIDKEDGNNFSYKESYDYV